MFVNKKFISKTTIINAPVSSQVLYRPSILSAANSAPLLKTQ